MVTQKVKAALDAADEGLVGMFLHFKGRNTEEGTQRSRRRHGDAQRFFGDFFSVPSVKAL
jgi:hypothetical protein